MTLCVAWRYEEKFCLASDSRIASAGDGYSDIGVKVLEAPIRVISAVDAETGNFEVLHESTIGMTFSGSFLTAHLVKERIAEVLTKLQYISDIRDLDFKKVAKICFKVYRHAIQKLVETYRYGHETDFIIMGRCPADDTPRAFKLFRNLISEELEMEEILTQAPTSYDAIGAGEDEFRARFTQTLAKGNCRVHFAVLHEIRKLIEDQVVPSVGGTIQYGHCDNDKPFSILGVMYYYENENGLLHSMPASRGIDIREIHNPDSPYDLFVKESFISPFPPGPK